MSKKVSFKRQRVAGPPKGTPWVWHTVDMKTTERWRKMSLVCRRLLERLEVEHMAHAGQDNGRLKVSYSQFVEWGIGRRHISGAIKEAVDGGFLEVHHGYYVKDLPNQYRLTYLPTRTRTFAAAYEWSAPTNEWKRLAGKSFFECTKGELTEAPKGELTGAGVIPTKADPPVNEVVSEGALTIRVSPPATAVPPSPVPLDTVDAAAHSAERQPSFSSRRRG